ncbi:transcription factor bHLH157-like [Andrographis paniculata]|uniref:transcription factor bHLH157-like n=1 Tax=Andrographis paniculata TaxID=175694 RepID=UPI0021E808E4|nr:transcription factor bHLH157-like [Andrographis paniculata]
MYSAKRDSVMKETLRSLCCSNGWCYGIFWGFDQRNSLLLTCKDAYYEEQMRALIDNMLMQVHVLGGGVVGQAAFTRNHRWMFLDDLQERQNCVGSSQSLDILEDDSLLDAQLSLGLKTIALISVEPWGVVQLGSTRKVLEFKDFIEQVKLGFRGIGEGQKLELQESSSDSHFLYSGTQFSTLLPCYASGAAAENFPDCANSDGFFGSNYSISPPSQLLSSSLNFTGSSSLIENQVQNGCKSSSPLDQLLYEPGSSFDCSALTASWSHLPSGGISSYECSPSSSLNALATTSLEGSQFSKDALNARDYTALIDPTCSNAPRPSSGLSTLDELFQDNSVAEDLCKTGPMDDFTRLLSPLACPSNASFSALSNDLSHLTGHTLVSKLSAENHPANSMQSSVTDAFKSSNYDSKFYAMSGVDKLLNGLGAETGCDQKLQSWNDQPLLNVSNGAGLDFNTNINGCMAEKAFGSKVATSNSLFSRLGLDHLLDGSASSSYGSFSKTRLEDQPSPVAKRRKVDIGSWRQDSEIRTAIDLKSETSAKGSMGLCVADSSNMGAGSSSSLKKQQDSAKNGKKKAKPGSRPRPKDRQMIQDRLAELRGLIPNGEKMSIDRLLERTIKHLNFMSSLAKHSESLKQVDKSKSRNFQKGHSKNDGGVTWACEVGDKSMVCPLIIEDLSTPGQMLIEILYEECGFFLEIIDIIRGFGLTVLKGVMEVRETKIWASFIVEAKGNRHGTRHEVFSSLIQLLQMTGGNLSKANEHFGNNISSTMPLFNNYQSVSAFPVNLADTIQCANL